jgi:hypothetical protein
MWKGIYSSLTNSPTLCKIKCRQLKKCNAISLKYYENLISVNLCLSVSDSTITRDQQGSEALVKHQELCYSSGQEHTFSYISRSARMARRKETIRHAILPYPHRLTEHSVLDIVLCYIFHDPRFWVFVDRFFGVASPATKSASLAPKFWEGQRPDRGFPPNWGARGHQ